MDQFMEEVVTKRSRTAENIVYALANVMMVVFAILAFAYLQSLTYYLAEGISAEFFIVLGITLVFAAGAVLLFLRRDRIKTEYEYTFTNGVMDFAQVYNNKKRKNLGTMNVKNVEAFGKVSSGSFQRYNTMPGIKRTNWFLNREAELYYFYFVKESQKRMIIIEPSEEMADYIRKSLSQGVYQIN